MKRFERDDLRKKSKDELLRLLREDELTLMKWNVPVERRVDIKPDPDGKGFSYICKHPYKKVRRRIAFIKALLGGNG